MKYQKIKKGRKERIQEFILKCSKNRNSADLKGIMSIITSNPNLERQLIDFFFSLENYKRRLKVTVNSGGDNARLQEDILSIVRVIAESKEEVVNKILSIVKDYGCDLTYGIVENGSFNLKLYFDFIKNQGIDKEKLISDICNIINFRKVEPKPQIVSIGIEFKKAQLNLRTYAFYKKPPIHLFNELNSIQKKSIERFLNILNLEKRAFYLVAEKFDNSGLASKKIYKIYESGIENDSNIMKEIEEYTQNQGTYKKLKSMFYPFSIVSTSLRFIKGNAQKEIYIAPK